MKSIESLAAELVATLKTIEESKVFGEIWLRVVPRSLYAELEAALNDKTRLASPDELRIARQQYESADVHFDDQAAASRVNPTETWVQAWVRVDAETLPVRDGRVCKTDMVWWRGEGGPEHVRADSRNHWENIRDFPACYQIEKPNTRLVYED